jgi:hypothetical protein
MISPDDPRLTAYASGDLSPEEVAAFETELASDPVARAEVERLRMLQAGLAEAFGAEAAGGSVRVGKLADESRKRWWWEMPTWVSPFASAACVVLILSSVMIPTVGSVRETARKTVDASNLRQIGHAALIYANDHKDRFPVADDVWSFAGILAKEGLLNDANYWVSLMDPANASASLDLTSVLTKDGSELAPQFREAKLAWAVALGGIVVGRDPSMTPIAWTRGLQADGTWSSYSPYGAEGGHVMFLGGNVQTYRNLNYDGGELVRYDGKGKTGNILEALPPGMRIGEYVPTEQEQRAWREMIRQHQKQQQRERLVQAWVPVALIAGAVGLCVVLALRRKWLALLAAFGFLVLLLASLPMC